MEGNNMMSSSCDHFYFWFCLTEEFNVVWVLWVGDVPIPCIMLVPWKYASVGGIPIFCWLAVGVYKGAPKVAVIKVDKFNGVEFSFSRNVVSSASVGWCLVVVEDDTSFDVFW